MKHPTQLVRDIIGHNYMECSKCKKEITNAQIGGLQDMIGKNLTIHERYGVRLRDGSLAAFGTNNLLLAKDRAKAWNGKVEDFEITAKQAEKSGSKVIREY